MLGILKAPKVDGLTVIQYHAKLGDYDRSSERLDGHVLSCFVPASF